MSTTSAPTILADLALARRLERVEGLSNVELVEARAKAFPEIATKWMEVAGTLAMFDGMDSPCTQTFGLGMLEPVTDAQFDQLEQFFQERGAKVDHEVCPLADEALVKTLHNRGYRPIEYTNVLYRPITVEDCPAPSSAASIQVRHVEHDDAGLWARTAALGWADVAPHLHDYLLELERIIPYQQNAHCFLAEKQGEPVAAGALCLFEGVTLLAGACTIPKFRKLGAQRALLEHRLRFGVEHGCDVAMIGAAPGSGSQRNAERQGFRIAYTRTKWRLASPRDS